MMETVCARKGAGKAVVLTILTLAVAVSAVALGSARAATTGDKVDRLIAAMSLDEKLGMVKGWPGAGAPPPENGRRVNVGFIPGVARLGIPSLTFTDGPAGVRMVSPPPELETTAMPAPVALAATFSSALARSYGTVLGRDSRARDQDVIFAPMANIVRVPQAGRNFETLGEDPFLMSRLVAPETRGIQDQGTIATVKHFAENNQENQRQTINVNVDERTLREIEAPGFEAAVRAGSASVMCAYNSVNGRFACENPTLLTEILREQWGFSGFVVSDYGANHSAGPALTAGLDIEFWVPAHFDELRPAILDGSVPVAALDAAVRHILTAMDRFGLLAHASPAGGTVVNRPVPTLPVEADARVARTIAEDGAVLLRNAGGTLPLRAADLRSLAVIGPTARQLLVGGGGSSRVVGFTEREKSPLTALRERVGSPGDITFAVGRDLQGELVPSSALSPPNAAPGQHGLLRTDNRTGATQIDPTIDFVGPNALPEGTNATWTGTLTTPTTGVYELGVQAAGTTAQVRVDGNVVANSGGIFDVLGTSLRRTVDGKLSNATGQLTLTAGPHAISVSAAPATPLPPFIPPSSGPVEVRLAWVTAQQRQANLEAAVAAARSARTAVVFAYNEGTEGTDRPSLALPNAQDELIAAIAAANPRTVVVLNTGDPVLMPWAKDVRSILQLWYPGQEGGDVTADLLVGAANPGGKLPVTFPASEQDTPFAGHPERYPGVNDEQFYSEGIFVGYRWYDAQDIAPLFAFGHGLSYTEFRYSKLRVRRGGDGLDVSFRVRNVGSRRGTEAPQVYAGPPPNPPVPMAVKSLAAFDRIELAPGQARRVTLHVGARQLSYWSTSADDWVVASGRRPVYVGASSRDIRLQTNVDVAPGGGPQNEDEEDDD
jgi:beta-glucosidase